MSLGATTTSGRSSSRKIERTDSIRGITKGTPKRDSPQRRLLLILRVQSQDLIRVRRGGSAAAVAVVVAHDAQIQVCWWCLPRRGFQNKNAAVTKLLPDLVPRLGRQIRSIPTNCTGAALGASAITCPYINITLLRVGITLIAITILHQEAIPIKAILRSTPFQTGDASR
jgi:hypothetical protein